MVPGNPWPLVPQIMDDGRGTPGLQIGLLTNLPVGRAHGAQGGIPEIAVIGKIIVFHRKCLYSSFQGAVDGILVACKEPAVTAFVEIHKFLKHILLAPPVKGHEKYP